MGEKGGEVGIRVFFFGLWGVSRVWEGGEGSLFLAYRVRLRLPEVGGEEGGSGWGKREGILLSSRRIGCRSQTPLFLPLHESAALL